MPTILIVEDNEDIRLNLVEYLESKNYQTDNTDDGLKALALTIVNKYDLIVLDIMIPGRSAPLPRTEKPGQHDSHYYLER